MVEDHVPKEVIMAVGRPSKIDQWLTDDGLNFLSYCKQTGLTDAQIAEKIGISDGSLRAWKRRFPPIYNALKKGKEFAIADAYKALTSMFKVQKLTEVTTQEWIDSEGNKHQTITTKVKEIPPEKTAVIFYMKAQAGWRDNIEIVDTADSDRVFEMLKNTQEQAESLPDIVEDQHDEEN